LEEERAKGVSSRNIELKDAAYQDRDNAIKSEENLMRHQKALCDHNLRLMAQSESMGREVERLEAERSTLIRECDDKVEYITGERAQALDMKAGAIDLKKTAEEKRDMVKRESSFRVMHNLMVRWKRFAYTRILERWWSRCKHESEQRRRAGMSCESWSRRDRKNDHKPKGGTPMGYVSMKKAIRILTLNPNPNLNPNGEKAPIGSTATAFGVDWRPHSQAAQQVISADEKGIKELELRLKRSGDHRSQSREERRSLVTSARANRQMREIGEPRPSTASQMMDVSGRPRRAKISSRAPSAHSLHRVDHNSGDMAYLIDIGVFDSKAEYQNRKHDYPLHARRTEANSMLSADPNPGSRAQHVIATDPNYLRPGGDGGGLHGKTGKTLPGAMFSKCRPKSVAEGKLRLAALKALSDLDPPWDHNRPTTGQ